MRRFLKEKNTIKIIKDFANDSNFGFCNERAGDGFVTIHAAGGDVPA